MQYIPKFCSDIIFFFSFFNRGKIGKNIEGGRYIFRGDKMISPRKGIRSTKIRIKIKNKKNLKQPHLDSNKTKKGKAKEKPTLVNARPLQYKDTCRNTKTIQNATKTHPPKVKTTHTLLV